MVRCSNVFFDHCLISYIEHYYSPYIVLQPVSESTGLRGNGLEICASLMYLTLGSFADGYHQYLVYCGWLCFELIFVLNFVIETKSKTLEETSVLFDGVEKPGEMEQVAGNAATSTMDRADGGAVARYWATQPTELDVNDLFSTGDVVDDRRSSAISSYHSHELKGLSPAPSGVRSSNRELKSSEVTGAAV